MKDLRERLEKLRADAAELALMSRRARDAEQRELFGRLAEEIAIEVLELEQVVKRQDVCPGPALQPDLGSADRNNVAPQVRSKQ